MKKTNLELLRIFAMFLIIVKHFSVFGGVMNVVSSESSSYNFILFIEGLDSICVNLYILISGYFLINSTFKWRKLFRIILDVVFFSVVLYLIFVWNNQAKFTWEALVYNVMPITNFLYWFATFYVILYILSPYLNILLKAMTKKEYSTMLIILIIFITIICQPLKIFLGFSIYWFIVLYMVGGYIRLHIHIDKVNKVKLYLLTLCSWFLIPLYSVLGRKFGILFKILPGAYDYASIVCFIASVLVFLSFLKMEIRNSFLNRIILFFSPLTFGVYLIHENQFIRSVLWEYIDAPAHIGEELPFYMLKSVLLIYLTCSMLVFFQKKLFKFFEFIPNQLRLKIKNVKARNKS